MNIIGSSVETLEESIKNIVFKEIIDKDLIIFLSEETKNALKDFYSASVSTLPQEKDKSDVVKKLWKNLLIDSICFLKLNDDREKLCRSTFDLYKQDKTKFKENFIKNFKKVRKLSSFGIDGLSKYFDEFLNFESVLYGTEKYYRDHVDHVINVWGIGIGILLSEKEENLDEKVVKKTLNIENFKFSDGFNFINKDFSFEFEEIIKEKEEALSKMPKDAPKQEKELKEKEIEEFKRRKFISKGEILALWTVIALSHDLGYPIEKSYKINEKLKNILNFFGKLNIDEFNYNFSLFNNFLVEKFLNIVSSKPVHSFEKNEEDKYKDGHTSIQSKYRDKIAKSLEDYKHGAFGSLLIFKTLTYFLETDYSYEKNILNDEDLRQFFIRRKILRAICGHTCPKLYHVNLNTIPFLLILCDELQEWGRPSFQDLKVGSIESPKRVKILKFDIDNKKTTIHAQVYCDLQEEDIEFNKLLKKEIDEQKPKIKENLQNKYKNDPNMHEKVEQELNKELEEHCISMKEIKNAKGYVYEKLVKDRFKMFHHLLRGAKDDYNRAFNFMWDVIIKDKILYRFVLNTDEKVEVFESLKTAVYEFKHENEPIYKRYLEIYE